MAHGIFSVHKDAFADEPKFVEYEIDADGIFTHKYAATTNQKNLEV